MGLVWVKFSGIWKNPGQVLLHNKKAFYQWTTEHPWPWYFGTCSHGEEMGGLGLSASFCQCLHSLLLLLKMKKNIVISNSINFNYFSSGLGLYYILPSAFFYSNAHLLPGKVAGSNASPNYFLNRKPGCQTDSGIWWHIPFSAVAFKIIAEIIPVTTHKHDRCQDFLVLLENKLQANWKHGWMLGRSLDRAQKWL